MDIAFSDEKYVFLVVYLDDVTVFSHSDDKHLHHLRVIFQKCRKFGISLNPKKSLFTTEEGKLLGHIISKDGIEIDPSRVEAIQKIDFPSSKKEIQAFNVVKEVLLQNDLKGRRGRWIAALLEYDLEIKMTKLIKGQGLAKLMAESNLHALNINLVAALFDNKEEVDLIQIVYGVEIVFPTSLAIPVIRLLQEAGSEENDIQHRINQVIHLEQTWEEVFQNTSKLHERIKRIYDQKTKEDDFKIGDMVLRWDARNKDKGEHGRFENLWKGPYQISTFWGQNSFLSDETNGEACLRGPVNGRLLKRYLF
eukprot:PITA_32994